VTIAPTATIPTVRVDGHSLDDDGYGYTGVTTEDKDRAAGRFTVDPYTGDWLEPWRAAALNTEWVAMHWQGSGYWSGRKTP
jgi:hypothetical protein